MTEGRIHLRQHHIKIKRRHESPHYAYQPHAERLGTHLFHYSTFQGQRMTYQHHDGDDSSLPHGECHRQHHSQTGVCRYRSTRKKRYCRRPRQAKILENGIQPLCTPFNHAVILQKAYRQRNGEHNLQQPPRRFQRRPHSSRKATFYDCYLLQGVIECKNMNLLAKKNRDCCVAALKFNPNRSLAFS